MTRPDHVPTVTLYVGGSVPNPLEELCLKLNQPASLRQQSLAMSIVTSCNAPPTECDPVDFMLQFGSWDDSRTAVRREAWCLRLMSTNQGHGSALALPQASASPSSQHPGSQMKLSGILGGRKRIRGQQVQR
jgi:hypothetical protein